MARVGYVFEDIVRESLPLLYDQNLIPFLPDRIGKTWGKVPNQKGNSYEIDIIGEKQSQLLVIECKWREKRVDDRQFNQFIENCSYLKTRKEIIPVFISKNGFVNPNVYKEKAILLDKSNLMNVFHVTPDSSFPGIV